MIKIFSNTIAAIIFSIASSNCWSAMENQDCQNEINRMRDIYIIILRKIPIMPPLAQLSRGIQNALNDAEQSRNSGRYVQCVNDMRRQIEIVEGYAR